MKKTNSVVTYYMFLVEEKNQNRLFLGTYICSAPGMVTWHNYVLFQRQCDDIGQDCLIIVNLFRG
jgi:hypothetical protein